MNHGGMDMHVGRLIAGAFLAVGIFQLILAHLVWRLQDFL